MSDENRIQLHGFNNLTKTLSFNLYDVCYTDSPEQRQQYIEYIDEEYNAERLTGILTDVAEIIGANILNIARQDYDPQGASVTMLVSEETVPLADVTNAESPGPDHVDHDSKGQADKDSVVAHLDKSHITVHTYPESHPDKGVSTFRADIDVSTCGVISPLKALNYLLHSFETDIASIDYRVRGFTRAVDGTKHFIDHEINSIQNYIDPEMASRYRMVDVNVYQENIFHTKLIHSEFVLEDYLFSEGQTSRGITPASEQRSAEERDTIGQQLQHEMLEIFYGRNMPEDVRPL